MEHVEEPGTGDPTVDADADPSVTGATSPPPPPAPIPAAPGSAAPGSAAGGEFAYPPPPSYAPPSYAPPSYPPPSYPPAFDYPPPSFPPPAGPARRSQQLEMSRGRRRLVAVLAVLGLLAVPAVVGYDLGQRNGTPSAGSPAISIPSGFGASSGSRGSSSAGAANGTVDATAIAGRVDDSVVNLTTTLSSGGEAAGTGIIISSTGLVVTNNHVIDSSTSIEAENSASGATYTGKVLGYDRQEDVALVQLEDASGLKAASLGTAASLSTGDPIVALGNAGGHGGSPTVVSGYVTGLDQQITASDQDGSNAEQLSGLVQIDADIQPGDSGGPLVNAAGDVVGMNAAASSGNGRFGFGQSGNEGYAIPIEHALAIAKKIASGQGGTGIHVGANRAMLGVAVASSSSGRGFGQASDGASVQSVQSGSAAEKAGIQAGDTITGLGGTAVSSAEELTDALVEYQPKDSVTVTWIDGSGTSHHATVALGSGPPA